MASELKSDRYEVEQEIGRGGMGIVYRARDTRLGRTVALKMLPVELMKDADLRRRLVQEARAASAFTHPAVATVYDLEEHAGENFIVYEYVEGSTLRQRLSERRFTAEEVLDLGVQLADALAAAHDRGVIHRDLKPENIILIPGPERLGRAKILDFGLAKVHRPLTPGAAAGLTQAETLPLATAPGTLVGTVNYMSPEQLEGETVDGRTDLYAMGLVLYELLTGANPFVGKTPSSTIANILRQEAPPLPELNPAAPSELDRILRKCVRKHREERYQSARELWVDLSNLRRDLSIPAGRFAGETSTVSVPPLTIPRALARILFLLIQSGYLVMYGVVFFSFKEDPRMMQMALGGGKVGHWLFISLFLCALCGTPVKLYLLSAVGFDYLGSGRLFRQSFPIVLLLDTVWATSPLLLMHKLGAVSLLCVAGLVLLPFAQWTLMLTAYAPSGGGTSVTKPPTSL